MQSSSFLYILVLFGITDDTKEFCRNTINVKEKTIQSPNYPHYEQNEHCVWLLNVPCNKQLKLHFEEFKLERKRDWLEICNKKQTGGTYGCKEYTGTKEPEAFLSEHNQVKIEFTSDFINNFKGFQIKAEIIGKSNTFYTSISIAFYNFKLI